MLFGVLGGDSSLAFAAEASASEKDLQPFIDKAKKLELHQDLQWTRLLHYQRGSLGGFESRADADSFFNSPEGRTNLQAELEETIKAFYQPQKAEEEELQHALCRFPARWRYLQRELGLPEKALPTVECPQRDHFREIARAKSVALVFSSYFMGNPSSTFGHTFLRFNRESNAEPQQKKHELLDVGVNYAAMATTQNPLFYAIGGIFGGFLGNFTVMPYFYKVREYNDFEARDLWSYELSLSEEEVEWLVDHFWELSSAGFRYYFFDENCSYYMLAAMDAVAPRLNLVENMGTPWAIPSDTLKAVMREPGLVSDIRFRPSERSIFRERLKSLNSQEKEALKELMKQRGLEDLASFTEDRQVLILDAALTEHDLRYRKELIQAEKTAGPWRQELLLARARIRQESPTVKVVPLASERPDLGHGSSRLGLLAGTDDVDESFLGFSARFSFHDLLDPYAGYPHNTRIEMGHLMARYFFESEDFTIDKFSVVELTTLNPLKEFENSPSWRAFMGVRRAEDRNCDYCLIGSFEGGYGYDVELAGWNFALLVDGEAHYSPDFTESSFRLAAGPRLMIYYGGESSVKVLTQAFWHGFLFSEVEQYFQVDAELRWSVTNEFSLGFQAIQNERDFTAQTTWYFYL